MDNAAGPSGATGAWVNMATTEGQIFFSKLISLPKQQKLVHSCRENLPSQLREVLQEIDPTFDNNLAIRTAARHGSVDALRVLLRDKRADPTTHDNYALRVARACGYKHVVRLLVLDDRVNNAILHNPPGWF